MNEAASVLAAAATTDVVVTATGLAKRYPSGEDVLEVLTATDLEIGAGQRIAVLGASGIGKSTLLHLLGAQLRPL